MFSPAFPLPPKSMGLPTNSWSVQSHPRGGGDPSFPSLYPGFLPPAAGKRGGYRCRCWSETPERRCLPGQAKEPGAREAGLTPALAPREAACPSERGRQPGQPFPPSAEEPEPPPCRVIPAGRRTIPPAVSSARNRRLRPALAARAGPLWGEAAPAAPFPSGFLFSSCRWESGSQGPAVFRVPLGKERKKERGPTTAPRPAPFNGLCGQWPLPADPRHRGRRSLDLAGQMGGMLGRATPRDRH